MGIRDTPSSLDGLQWNIPIYKWIIWGYPYDSGNHRMLVSRWFQLPLRTPACEQTRKSHLGRPRGGPLCFVLLQPVYFCWLPILIVASLGWSPRLVSLGESPSGVYAAPTFARANRPCGIGMGDFWGDLTVKGILKGHFLKSETNLEVNTRWMIPLFWFSC